MGTGCVVLWYTCRQLRQLPCLIVWVSSVSPVPSPDTFPFALYLHSASSFFFANYLFRVKKSNNTAAARIFTREEDGGGHLLHREVPDVGPKLRIGTSKKTH